MNVIIPLILLLTTSFFFLSGLSCNETVCGPIVSKCLLTQACSCDLQNCTCCKECSICLANLFVECCSCLKLCPNSIESKDNLSKTSNVEDFLEGVPELFKVLTDYPDPLDRWTVYIYPVKIDSSMFLPKPLQEIYVKESESEPVPKNSHVVVVNCTVAYLARCMSMTKCKASCQTMGSSSFRWFHDGCCECIGRTCINYGINESRCRNCGPSRDVVEDYSDELEEILDYGEDDNKFDYAEEQEEYEFVSNELNDK